MYCSVHGKNALDFELAAYFGSILERPDIERISIISMDAGFAALEDYARKKRKSVKVYRGRSILEAYVAANAAGHPRLYEKGKKVDFKVIMDDLKRRREFEKSIRDRIETICDRNRSDVVVELLLQEPLSARDTYLSLLKLLGRNDGLAVYRLVKDILK